MKLFFIQVLATSSPALCRLSSWLFVTCLQSKIIRYLFYFTELTISAGVFFFLFLLWDIIDMLFVKILIFGVLLRSLYFSPWFLCMANFGYVSISSNLQLCRQNFILFLDFFEILHFTMQWYFTLVDLLMLGNS